jgi:hypothetical protein
MIDAFATATVIPLIRLRIERERDGAAWLVIRAEHGWMCRDRRRAQRLQAILNASSEATDEFCTENRL